MKAVRSLLSLMLVCSLGIQAQESDDAQTQLPDELSEVVETSIEEVADSVGIGRIVLTVWKDQRGHDKSAWQDIVSKAGDCLTGLRAADDDSFESFARSLSALLLEIHTHGQDDVGIHGNMSIECGSGECTAQCGNKCSCVADNRGTCPCSLPSSTGCCCSSDANSDLDSDCCA